MLCLCAARLKFWFQTDLGCENSASYYRQGRHCCFWLFSPWSHVGHALRSIFFCSDWSKFDRWVHAGNLCSILKLVYFDSWSWQSFLSTCDVVNCLFPLDVQKSLLLFMASLFIAFLVEKYVACQSRKSDFGWHQLWNTAFCPRSDMIKTAPHSTVSPQMWFIKSRKGWFTRPQICWQDFVKVKLSNAKNSAWFVSKNLFSRPNPLWSRAIMSL